MRKYDVLYSAIGEYWLVIAKDLNDKYWFVFQDNIEDQHTAEHIANALNRESSQY